MCLAALPYGLNVGQINQQTRFLLLVSSFLDDFIRAAAVPLRIPTGPRWCWYNTLPGNLNRARILAQLDATPGEHLVIVRYEPQHDTDWEWVYSEGDNRPVKSRLWARDMGTAQNEELIEYFKGRRVWVVDADEDTTQLVPYEERPESVGRN